MPKNFQCATKNSKISTFSTSSDGKSDEFVFCFDVVRVVSCIVEDIRRDVDDDDEEEDVHHFRTSENFKRNTIHI